MIYVHSRLHVRFLIRIGSLCYLSIDYTNVPSADEFIKAIRDRIYSDLGITASAGISSNLLLARLSTRKAKPNGLIVLSTYVVDNIFCCPFCWFLLVFVGFFVVVFYCCFLLFFHSKSSTTLKDTGLDETFHSSF